MSRKLADPISELGGFHNTTGTSNLSVGGDLGEGTVMSDLKHLSSICLEENSPCEGLSQSQVMIDILPDNALLEIFHFYKDDPESSASSGFTWTWKTLIHVCRRWRYIIFGSPRRLDLRLVCSHRTPVRRLLDIWPPFPISLFSSINWTVNKKGLGNIVTTLAHRGRISRIYIYDLINGAALEKSMAAMHEPFPVLTSCSLFSSYNSVSMPILPVTFLGGSAPNLELFHLWGIPFPTFPKFILSSTQIQVLFLDDIPDSGYISPGSMATCLAALPNLTTLSIGFRSPPSQPVQIGPRPLTRTVLPSLVTHYFEGASEYFEDFVARIDAPEIEWLTVSFFMDVSFDLPQLRNFVSLTQTAKQANIEFTTRLIKIILWSQSHFELGIKSERLDRQLSSMTQIFSQQLPFLSYIERLEILDPRPVFNRIGWRDDPDMDPSQWLELFRLLISVEDLFVSERLVHRVAGSLKDLTGAMAMEVLPALRNLLLEGFEPSGPVQDDIKSFVTARQLTNYPVLVQPWER